MPTKPRLAVDMDDVIAETTRAQRAWFAEHFGYVWTDDAHPLAVVDEAHADELEAALHVGELFAGFEVMPGSQAALQHLSATYEIFIASAAMDYPRSCAAKYRWLQQHFAFIPASHIVFCGDKSILDVDYLLDDNVRHFRRLRGQGVLFSAPHNRAERWAPRVTGWSEALAFFAAQLETRRPVAVAASAELR